MKARPYRNPRFFAPAAKRWTNSKGRITVTPHDEHTIIEPLSNTAINRRRFLAQSAIGATSAAIALRFAAERLAAAEATPIPVDPAALQQLTDLSRTLAGGGNFDSGRVSILSQLLSTDTDLATGLDELLKTPPVEGQSLGSDHAQKTAQAILLFWYADVFDDKPLPDRSTAYYQLTAWQAMYTPSWAICKAFGGWADAPRTDPLVAANS